MAEVQIRALRKRYGDNEVVRGIDLDIGDGEVLALLGPSGCGKTTTLRIVAGLEDPDEGTVVIGGEPVSSPGRSVPPERRGLGMVFQGYAVWPHLDVLQNVRFPLDVRGVPLREADQRAKLALAQVRLSGLEARYPNQLSGGQQQRVAFARAIVADPRVLLLDEPLSNLDARLREEMRDEIRALVKRLRVTVILVTHDQEEALSLADRVAVMDQGVIQQVDAPRDLYDRPRNLRVARAAGHVNELAAIRAEGGVRVGSAFVPAAPTDDAPGEGPCILGFRPEQAEFAQDGPIVGAVRSRVRLGGRVRCRVETPSAWLTVEAPWSPEEGQEARLRVTSGFILGRLTR